VRDSTDAADLVTRQDLEIALSPLKADLLLLKWMMGVVVTGIIALILRTFFHA
jgi:hypothetical protein